MLYYTLIIHCISPFFFLGENLFSPRNVIYYNILLYYLVLCYISILPHNIVYSFYQYSYVFLQHTYIFFQNTYIAIQYINFLCAPLFQSPLLLLVSHKNQNDFLHFLFALNILNLSILLPLHCMNYC